MIKFYKYELENYLTYLNETLEDLSNAFLVYVALLNKYLTSNEDFKIQCIEKINYHDQLHELNWWQRKTYRECYRTTANIHVLKSSVVDSLCTQKGIF